MVTLLGVALFCVLVAIPVARRLVRNLWAPIEALALLRLCRRRSVRWAGGPGGSGVDGHGLYRLNVDAVNMMSMARDVNAVNI